MERNQAGIFFTYWGNQHICIKTEEEKLIYNELFAQLWFLGRETILFYYQFFKSENERAQNRPVITDDT